MEIKVEFDLDALLIEDLEMLDEAAANPRLAIALLRRIARVEGVPDIGKLPARALGEIVRQFSEAIRGAVNAGE